MKQKYIFHLEVFPNMYNRALAMPAKSLKECYRLVKRWCDYNCETKGRELKSIDTKGDIITLNFCGRDIKFKYEIESINN